MAAAGDIITDATARFDEFARRDDSVALGTWVNRRAPMGTAARARRIATAVMAVVGLILATLTFAFIIGPIGLGGLALVIVAMVALLAIVSLWPTARLKPVAPFQDAMSNAAIVQRLGQVLNRGRATLPAAAVQRTDLIAQALPQLESQLAALDPLDPLAQDARRLMGQHLPELIQRYEQVPSRYRSERDGGGLSVDQRLVVALDSARTAIADIDRRLAQDELAAFETQGRFIEDRYKDEAPGLPGPTG